MTVKRLSCTIAIAVHLAFWSTGYGQELSVSDRPAFDEATTLLFHFDGDATAEGSPDGASLPEAALVGCLVASITIQQLATTGTARRDELPDRLGLWLTQQQEAQP